MYTCCSPTGFWYRNYGALSSIPNVRLHSIDWLGNGQSTRIPMPKEPEKAEEVCVRAGEG